MCGIAGIIGEHPEGKILLDNMLKAQQHRGPDATCTVESPGALLGHNRLSIIDLSSESNQPMISACGRWVLVFNGEIYNYRELKSLVPEHTFRTQSDTEVILALYQKMGPSMLEKLNGMFSILLWDRQEKTAFAARDRFGVKPFYFSLMNGCLFFASEIKSLWAAGVKKEASDKVWASYLVKGSYGLPEETFWSGIHQLRAGHSMLFRPGMQRPEISCWYHFTDRIYSIQQKDAASLREEYEALLADAVRLRFRADVPVGFNLSGGLDSSTLLAMVKEVMPGRDDKIEAFTFYCGDERYDELPWVRGLLSKTAYHLNPVLLSAAQVPEGMEKLAHFQDEPFGGFPTLAYAGIFEKARSQGVIVLLDGQGMDEAWAGYDYYRSNSGSLVQGVTTSPVRPGVLDPEFASLAETESGEAPFGNRLQDLQYRDIFYTKIPRALRFNDRISMMHSTELREPFLDYRLVELAFAQPEEMKIRQGQGKWLLRELVSERLGNDLAFSPKRALQTPQREWLASELKEWARERLDVFCRFPFADQAKVMKEWERYQMGDQDNSFYLWQWINLSYLQP